MLTLELAHLRVVGETAFLEQLPVGSLFDGLAFIDHNDIISVTHRAQLVGDEKGMRPWLSTTIQGINLLNLLWIDLHLSNTAIFGLLHSA